MSNKYYSMKEVAELLHVSGAQVYYLKNTGQLKVKKIGAQYVATSKEIKRMIELRRRDGGSDAE